ncbi:MAG: hypothetical protein ABI697_04650 [Devosia sp.]
MARRYTLISLIPFIGEPLAFWLRNRASIAEAASGARRGMQEGGVGGGLIGLVGGLGADQPGQAPSELGETLRRMADDPNTDPRLAAELRKAQGGTGSPPSKS